MTYDWIEVDQHDGIVKLSLNDPSTLNAVNHEMNLEIASELERVEADDTARLVVLTGKGDGFCSGGNIKRMTTQGKSLLPPPQPPRKELFPHLTDIGRVVYGLRSLSKPTIAAVNGPAIGSGVGIAAGCDIRIASEKARFGWVFIRRGIMPDDGSLPIITQLIGYQRAFEWGATGRTLSALQALEIQFVSRVVPHEDLMPICTALAREIIDNSPPITLELFKMVLSEALDLGTEQTMILTDKAQTIARATDDHTEALRAFMEKRKPVWKRK